MRIAITLAAGVLALLAITAALGHASPERFDPAPGQVLTNAPSRVDGWFTQDIRRQEEQSRLRVYRVEADGSLSQQVDTGATVIDDSDRRHMYVDLAPDLGAGEYAVAWQTLSDEDDEPDGNCYRFFVGLEAAAAAHDARSRIDVAGDCPTSAVAAPPAPQSTIELDVSDISATGDVTVNLSSDATIRLPTSEGRDPNFAHYHLYLDVAPELLHSHDDEEGGEANPDEVAFSGDLMTTEDSHTFKGLEPGVHTIFAALFYDDHSPFVPPVVTGTTFTVPGSGGGDGDGLGTVAVIGIAAATGVIALLVGRGLGRMRGRRR
jgi:methionine-rich copper-binding protein CopC